MLDSSTLESVLTPHAVWWNITFRANKTYYKVLTLKCLSMSSCVLSIGLLFVFLSILVAEAGKSSSLLSGLQSFNDAGSAVWAGQSNDRKYLAVTHLEQEREFISQSWETLELKKKLVCYTCCHRRKVNQLQKSVIITFFFFYCEKRHLPSFHRLHSIIKLRLCYCFEHATSSGEILHIVPLIRIFC